MSFNETCSSSKKTLRQNWDDGERKEICKYAAVYEKHHGAKPKWLQIKTWWEKKYPTKVISFYYLMKMTELKVIWLSYRRIRKGSWQSKQREVLFSNMKLVPPEVEYADMSYHSMPSPFYIRISTL